MKVSVIIPAHNEEKVIELSLKAVLAQNYPDFEVIVIDNASTDKTTEVVEKIGVKVINEVRKGTMWACEAGRKASKGEIIVRMDADCIPNPDWLSKGVEFFKDENVVVASGPYDFYDANPSFRQTASLIYRYIFVNLNKFIQAIGVNGGITMGGNTFIRSSALESAGGFNTAITFYGDDTDVPKRLSKFGKIIFDESITLKSSARRFKNEGAIRLQSKYIYHFFKTLLTR